MVYIYGLIDPRKPEEFRYIGKTNNIKKRLRSHINSSKKAKTTKVHCKNWINTLLRDGIEPNIILIREVSDENWESNEIELIASYKEQGHRLTNILEGGQAGRWRKGVKHSPEHLKKISEALKKYKRSEEHKKSLSQRVFTDEWREKLSEAGKNKIFTEEHKEKLSKAARGRKLSEETKRKLSEARTKYWKEKHENNNDNDIVIDNSESLC